MGIVSNGGIALWPRGEHPVGRTTRRPEEPHQVPHRATSLCGGGFAPTVLFKNQRRSQNRAIHKRIHIGKFFARDRVPDADVVSLDESRV